MTITIAPIAYIRTGFSEKFGIPRQSLAAKEPKGIVEFAEPYRDGNALRGLSAFSHIWLIWQFSNHAEKVEKEEFRPTVRPPRLGGNERMGVFATRSPYRPNSLGLSLVKLEEILMESVYQEGEKGPALLVSGVDLLDGTPIFDIKPYIPFLESVPDARGGFTEGPWTANKENNESRLAVVFAPEAKTILTEHAEAVEEILSLDPRPSYQEEEKRVYGLEYAGYNVRFRVEGDTVKVIQVEPLENKDKRE